MKGTKIKQGQRQFENCLNCGSLIMKPHGDTDEFCSQSCCNEYDPERDETDV